MLASISEGTTRIKNLLMADDIVRTIGAFRSMGVPLSLTLSPKGRGKGEGRFAADATVRGVGMRGLKKPKKSIYLGNSGTTMRILPGILAGQDFEVVLKGDASLSKRPMRRIAEPLKKMGAEIASAASQPRNDNAKHVIASEAKQSYEIYPPLKIKGGKLKAIKYKSKIASAQVKSCVLLAGLFAKGVTSVNEPVKSRDHTERMLEQFGVKLFSTRSARSKNIVRARPKAESRTIKLRGPVKLKAPRKITVPGDISSAAFFIVAACILPDMKIVLKNVGINPTRTGIIDILKRMGANIKVKGKGCRVKGGEPCGDIVVRSSKLRGVTISAREFVRAIDEIPIIMVAACFAMGATIIKGINELRVKETDRVRSMVTNLRKLGADVRSLTLTLSPKGRGKGEGIIVSGNRRLHAAKVSSFGDHRTAMSMLVADLAIKGKVSVTGRACINKSFPGFLRLLHRLI
ncbi:MAG: 3-phosphoshikimate 1-carboxyvinyltransferase [Candidatus Omnitrophica bacterium]|nr:3-phosphoshikimate 1-carboxyvinyltransferase [Candidatus Omnitrophota bacterium]MBU4590633.1 3-phosphoshikimate 1-carboxyvinyltransferase [Candidatus Omnitrophota bacterium]